MERRYMERIWEYGGMGRRYGENRGNIGGCVCLFICGFYVLVG